MGFAFFNTDVDKTVDINKVVNLDVNKFVEASVNINGHLATAEASADALGDNTLAETDTFAQATETGSFSFSESLAASQGAEQSEDVADTIAEAPDFTADLRDDGVVRIENEFIGDNPNLAFLEDDVDVFRFDLSAGELVTFDIDAEVIGSPLDSVLRVFDAAGSELAFNDDDGIGLDSFIFFRAPADGDYYVGVSSFDNFDYDPNVEGSGNVGFTAGEYELEVQLRSPSEDVSDTIAEAEDFTADLRDDGVVRIENEFIGDNPDLAFLEDDVDVFRFDLSAGEFVTFDIDADINGSSLDSVLRVFDAAGNQLAFNDQDGGSNDSFVGFSVSAAGAYYVGVSSYANGFYDPNVEGSGFDGFTAGEYDLTVQFAPPPPPDVADTIAEAPDFTADLRDDGIARIEDRFIGNNLDVIPAEDDVDMFRFDLSAGEFVTFDIDAEINGSSLDSYLRVFDAAGTELAANDDDFDSLDSFIPFLVPADGDYYVGVSALGNTSYDPNVEGSGEFGGSRDFYDLTVQVTPLPPDVADTIAEAPDFTADLRDDGVALIEDRFIGNNPNTSFPEDDVDMFRFGLLAGEFVTFDIDAAINGSSLDSVLRVFDAAGNQLAFNDQDGGSNDSFVGFSVSADGDYYVGVSSFANGFYDPNVEGSGVDGFSTGEYDLEVRFAPPPPPDVGDIIAEAEDFTADLRDDGVARIENRLIGNNPNTSFPEDDVDMFRFDLLAGEFVTFDIAAAINGSFLDSVLRVFDAAGSELALSDDDGFGLDSFVEFQAPADGDYYVGISSFANFDYDPNVEGSGFVGETSGEYDLEVQLV